MLTDEQRIKAIHSRAASLEKQANTQKMRIMQTAAFAVCFGAVIAVACFMPNLAAMVEHETLINNMTASIFSDSNTLGFIVIAVIAFVRGVAETVFCYKLKKWRDNYPSEFKE